MGTGTLDISEARKQLNKLDERLRDERVIRITRHNKEAFAMIDLGFLQAIMETLEIMSDPDAYHAFMQSLKDIEEGNMHDHDDVRRELL